MARSGSSPNRVRAALFLFPCPRHRSYKPPDTMTMEVTILIADDDAGHARLIEKNLGRAGLHNATRRFEDGQQVLDFFFGQPGPSTHRADAAYLLLLDIRMPKVDGVEVLRRLKGDR